ncbi:uncharacterized protein LOC133722863 [Rosa rugosa]|uniref:uncharacterized protein LOC133722863 n=1 Tax=Rosa rugosa TaxID=74645 RepID=UPI002B411D22|nr:uncharacterized protein LOC133722863 [Rosa rugosa]
MSDMKLVVNRRFPAILANEFLPRPGHREEAMMMFRRTISCSDIQLATDELSYELYAPNHFARQFGLAQLVPWPLVDSANYYTSWRRSAPPGSAPFQSQFTLIVIPPWVRALYPLNDVDDDYADWWKEVSVNCWGMNNYDLFAILFRDLEHPFAVDSDILEQYYAGEAPPPVPAPPQHQPVPPPQPQRPSRQAQPGIQIREHGASRTTRSRAASTQAGKQKAVAEEPPEGESFDDDDVSLAEVNCPRLILSLHIWLSRPLLFSQL